MFTAPVSAVTSYPPSRSSPSPTPFPPVITALLSVPVSHVCVHTHIYTPFLPLIPSPSSPSPATPLQIFFKLQEGKASPTKTESAHLTPRTGNVTRSPKLWQYGSRSILCEQRNVNRFIGEIESLTCRGSRSRFPPSYCEFVDKSTIKNNLHNMPDNVKLLCKKGSTGVGLTPVAFAQAQCPTPAARAHISGSPAPSSLGWLLT